MATHSADGGPGTAAGVTGTASSPSPASPGASSAGGEGARRVLAVLGAFSPRHHTHTARGLAKATGIPLPSMYRYIALLRDTGILVGDDRGSYHLSGKIITLARAAEAAGAETGTESPAGESGEAETSGTSGIDGSESV